jgi:ribonuclease Z
MPTLHFLGTGSAVTDPHRTTTMLAVEASGSVLVIDCGGDVVQRMLGAGLLLEEVSAVIVTHEHPDHVAGFPLMVQKLWLSGRTAPLPVYGISQALDQARRCIDAFDTSGWEGLPPIEWNRVAHTADAPVMATSPWHITATPSLHGVPSIALRIEHGPSGAVFAYSSDTAPSEEIARFAKGAQVLVHEATGALPGHSSANDAARIAAEAGAGRLYLVHLPHESELNASHLATARGIFSHTFKANELEAVDY